jgi:methionine-rich copper-binding protein CopC/putative copper export protein
MTARRFLSLALLACALPVIASAHALPVASHPASSQVLDAAPETVQITFSEHIDPAASQITVTGPSGATVSTAPAHTDAADTHTLVVPVRADGDGAYLVSWSVVSADDGHFTKGGYPFAVGSGASLLSATTTQGVEIVELSTTPEALASGVELLGHGFLWAVLVLFAFGMRPLLRGGAFADERKSIGRAIAWIAAFAAACALGGGLAQVLIKASQLASLQSLPFAQALHTYIATSAGAATLWRMIAAALFAALFFFGRRAILAASRFTLYEWGMLAALLVFAFMRAKISHATSNPFHPHFSILVNFFHVVEKDIWAGITGTLLLLCALPRLRRFAAALVPRAFAMLAIDFGAVGVTASYIVWLHLKGFGNLFTTQWGAVFLELFAMAVVLVGMRAYHVWSARFRPALFGRALPLTLAVEFAFATLVVYCSSLVIITSPPLSAPPSAHFSASDQGARIELSRDPYQDGMLLLTTSAQETAAPVVVLTPENGDAVSVALTKKFDGGYVFPLSFVSAEPETMQVTVVQSSGYDAHARFSLQASDFTPPDGWEGKRPFDLFTLVMLLAALAIAAAAFVLYRFSPREPIELPHRRRHFSLMGASVVLLCALFFGGNVIAGMRASGIENPFAAECRGDGNEWHVMLPTMAGKPTSETPAEGCMWGMGNYMYMFADKREYDHYKDLGPAQVALATNPADPVAGAPVTLTVSLKNADGSPATLFVDMEKLLHIVIVSKDESVYAHIHADDDRPLTQEEIDTSTFQLRYTFPKSGDYLVMADFAHGTKLESQQFTVQVGGGNPQASSARQYPLTQDIDGYHVVVDYFQPFAGEVATFRYTITKDGQLVEMVPYLSAAMHIAAVKNDLSWHYHAHGEVHPPGTPLPPIIVKNGEVLHSMAMMVVPDTFALPVEAHLIFPSAGLYTVWGQFKTQSGDLVAAPFTVRVER